MPHSPHNGQSSTYGDWANSDWAQLLLGEMPQAAYLSSPTGQGFGAQSPRHGRYFQQAYQDVYGDYLGKIGTALREGREPSNFESFLQSNPWTKRYSQLPQYQRGVTKQFTDPRTRFLFY
jgi:hypothetical protein